MEEARQEVPESGTVPVSFNFDKYTTSLEVKSSILPDENALNTVQVFAYSSGRLEAETYAQGTEIQNIKLNLKARTTYNFYFLGNIARIEAPINENEIKGYRYTLPSSMSMKYIPMAATIENRSVNSASESFNVVMIRLAARINFTFNQSGTSNSDVFKRFIVTSVTLKQVPLDVAAFQAESKATRTANGDYASVTDKEMINSGRPITFYMLENCNGNLLPGNSDPWRKTPESLPESVRSLCTYIEISADVDGKENIRGNLKYRFYLGENTTSDFTVRRNSDYNFSLSTTQTGIDRISWKIEKNIDWGNIPVSLTKNTMYIAQTQEIIFNTIRSEINLSLSQSSNLESNDYVRLHKIARNRYRIEALKAGTQRLYFSGNRYNPGYVDLTVKAPTLSLSPEVAELRIDGSYTSIEPVYKDENNVVIPKSQFDSGLYNELLSVNYTVKESMSRLYHENIVRNEGNRFYLTENPSEKFKQMLKTSSSGHRIFLRNKVSIVGTNRIGQQASSNGKIIWANVSSNMPININLENRKGLGQEPSDVQYSYSITSNYNIFINTSLVNSTSTYQNNFVIGNPASGVLKISMKDTTWAVRGKYNILLGIRYKRGQIETMSPYFRPLTKIIKIKAFVEWYAYIKRYEDGQGGYLDYNHVKYGRTMVDAGFKVFNNDPFLNSLYFCGFDPIADIYSSSSGGVYSYIFDEGRSSFTGFRKISDIQENIYNDGKRGVTVMFEIPHNTRDYPNRTRNEIIHQAYEHIYLMKYRQQVYSGYQGYEYAKNNNDFAPNSYQVDDYLEIRKAAPLLVIPQNYFSTY